MEVEEVLLDVLVTDRKDNAVIGLTAGDFVVEEDGEPVELTGATFYSSSELLGDPAELEERGADIDVLPRDRYFILLLEDQRKNSVGSIDLVSQQLRAARDARRWIAGTLAPADWVAVLSYDFKLKLHADFTRDRAELDAALDAAVSGRDGGNWPSRREGAEDRPSLAQYMPSGDDLRDETTRMYGALEVIAESSGHLPGRKNLLLFTIGLGDTDRFGLYQREQRYWPSMVRALNDANVAVYTLDLTPRDVRHSLEGSLNDLAEETGGRYFYNFATYRAPLDQIAQENGGYYLLSYRSEHPAGKDGFQKVRVRVADPGLQVRTRDGYGY
jgi:VWFA-related protein